MQFVFLLTGLALVFVIGWLVSSDRKHIKFKRMGIMFALQLLISFFCLNTSGGIHLMGNISNFFTWLMEQAAGGVNFVFGGLVVQKGASVFFLDVLMPIVFISALVGILNYLKILPFIIKWTGYFLNKLAGMGELESYFAVSTAILGQPEVFLTIKEKIPKLDEKRLYTICASAMSAVSATVLASYMQLVPGKFVVTAVFLNILSALIVSCIINPYEVSAEEEISVNTTESLDISKKPFFQVLGDYIQDGFKLAITVAAMLIGFVALVTFLNSTFAAIFDIEFTTILGYIFSPIAFLMGVPAEDITQVGSLMASKILTNEFVALGELNQVAENLSPKGEAIISSYLISFANFGVVGIITGSIKSISEKQGGFVASFSMKLLLGATLASILTGTIVGLYF
ncbi:NupC/NupG family nucleoside CNT transporter [Tetragenococcus halophilus]|uniref:Nucleoside permease NupC n=2 Tax=Tetragenococcus halophilus TaxID=51669 RepID=A0A2H6CVB1_TETHA|nr:nucleoside transporter C-terminal domain-containing protein [Tetragenococcus halophilus]MDN6140734.1 NupC/NupG family nucleoside CNT transporter [Tetragenococcus koreensis]MDN6641453.1 NupC/NupG family nucleoside CNT transporter [Tetragenococcus sp.]MDN6836882.1 NupC/NupG family nucleoside CNT transporter [Lactococcus lactis]MCF1602282.1 NupC/NupG family nucleoside CNT transporter [Tetragenococcus halophilus]MCO8286005.1 NupC/NupG family nucleoside CNT transporter [Tetragenococcus halophilu